MIISSLARYLHEDKPGEGFDPKATLKVKLFIIIPYLIIFAGYFIHSLSLSQIINGINIIKLIKIEADPFLENLFEEIKDISPLSIIISIIVILFLSLCSFVAAWIISIIYTKKYMKLLKNYNLKKFGC